MSVSQCHPTETMSSSGGGTALAPHSWNSCGWPHIGQFQLQTLVQPVFSQPKHKSSQFAASPSLSPARCPPGSPGSARTEDWGLATHYLLKPQDWLHCLIVSNCVYLQMGSIHLYCSSLHWSTVHTPGREDITEEKQHSYGHCLTKWEGRLWPNPNVLRMFWGSLPHCFQTSCTQYIQSWPRRGS